MGFGKEMCPFNGGRHFGLDGLELTSHDMRLVKWLKWIWKPQSLHYLLRFEALLLCLYPNNIDDAFEEGGGVMAGGDVKTRADTQASMDRRRVLKQGIVWYVRELRCCGNGMLLLGTYDYH